MKDHYIISNFLESSKTFDVYRRVFEARSLFHRYSPVEIPTNHLSEISDSEFNRLRKFFLDFRANPNAVSVVISNPFKQIVLEFCDELSVESKNMGAVNLIVKRDEDLSGLNIDGEAFWLGQKKTTHYDFAGKTVLILGCGGVATAVAFKLASAGVGQLKLFDIRETRQKWLHEKLMNNFPQQKVNQVSALNQKAILGVDVIYNATGVGKNSNDPSSILATPFPPGLSVANNVLAIDANYTPWTSRFLQNCKNQGCQITNGYSHMIAFVALHLSIILDMEIDFGTIKAVGDECI